LQPAETACLPRIAAAGGRVPWWHERREPESATPTTVLFTADTHFGHAGALGLYRRPFASVAAMDAALIEHWNRAVAPTDEVYHLGDVAMTSKRERIEALLSALHGRKHLITGNNDRAGTREARGWSTVQPYLCAAHLARHRQGRVQPPWP